MVAFKKIVRRAIQQRIDDLGRWSWMAFEGEDNEVILSMSIYQCCKIQPILKERRLITNKKQRYQKGIEMTVIRDVTFTKICVNSSEDSKRRQTKESFQWR